MIDGSPVVVTVRNLINILGVSECVKNEFSVPADPKAIRLKGEEKKRKFSMLSSTDFSRIIENGDFDNWDWGDYILKSYPSKFS